MLTDFKGFNSVIYSTSYIAKLCEKKENAYVNWGHSHVFDTKIPSMAITSKSTPIRSISF